MDNNREKPNEMRKEGKRGGKEEETTLLSGFSFVKK